MNKSDYIDTFKDKKITVMGQGSLYHAIEAAWFRSLRTLGSQRPAVKTLSIFTAGLLSNTGNYRFPIRSPEAITQFSLLGN